MEEDIESRSTDEPPHRCEDGVMDQKPPQQHVSDGKSIKKDVESRPTDEPSQNCNEQPQQQMIKSKNMEENVESRTTNEPSNNSHEEGLLSSEQTQEQIMDTKNPVEDVESRPTAEPSHNSHEEGGLDLEQPQQHRRGLGGCYDRVKKKLTCGCSKVTVRVIKLCLSLWQIGDMISDGLSTKKYLDLAEVRRVVVDKHDLRKMRDFVLPSS